ncbi:hypothetical protein MY11210_009708 [Beauveria gryllotalpidicola]
MFTNALALIAIIALGAEACTPGEYQCGNQGGAPGPDGSIQVCDISGRWRFASRCGGPTCCVKDGDNVVCKC